MKLFKHYYCFAAIFAIVLSVSSFAQENELSKKIPVDPNVKIGKLDNGLTYYIRKNTKPENRAELRLVVNAGSVQENEEQLGLAHFVEHMCFNGTKHFEKNELINYLQLIGTRFGPDLNGYTSFDETVYILAIPTDSVELFENGFLVLKDWAHNVTFDHEEIDKERGVVIEEWRIGRGANQRMRDKYLPVMLKDSRYAERLPIGKKEIIENASYETIKQFYKDWYRPDLMAFIAVGDFNVNEVEQKIKSHFKDLKTLQNTPKRETYQVKDHKGTLVSVQTDKEASRTTVELIFKTDVEPQETFNDYRRNLTYRLFTSMINQRLSELREKPEPPFLYAGIYYGNLWVRTKNAFLSYAMVDENGIEMGIQTLLEELKRVQVHGFTESELERTKINFLNGVERQYKEKDKTESRRYTWQYIRNYLEQEPIPGIKWEYDFVKKHITTISLDEVNALIDKWITDDNRIILVTGPEKEGITMPNGKDLLALVKNVENEKVTPYIDNLASSKLMEKIPETGNIVSERKINEIDATELILSNGAKVILKTTDFQNDDIQFRCISEGGYSLYPDEHFQSAKNCHYIVRESGVGQFTRSNLRKVLAGKTVSLTPSVSRGRESIWGACAPKDMESMCQLLNLYFTQPRIDENSFKSYINKTKSSLKNRLASPISYYYDAVSRIKYQNNIRSNHIPTEEEINSIDFDKVFEIYKERYADASDFTFYFVGAFDINELKPLIKTYIASLPALNKSEKQKDNMIRPPQRIVDTIIRKGIDPKSIVTIYFEGEAEWSEWDSYLMNKLGKVLQRKYYEIIREEMSGVYGIGARVSLNKTPYENYQLNISFPCSPDNVDKLTKAVFEEIRKIQNEGISDDDLKKVHEIEKTEMEVNLKKNNFWIDQLKNCEQEGTNYDRLTKYNEWISNITSDEIKRVADKYIDMEKYIRVVLMPDEKAQNL